MYIALGVMILGMAIGWLFNNRLNQAVLQRLTLGAIFLLLFLLGLAIGANQDLLSRLPSLGLQALALMLAGVGGSIAAALFIKRFLTMPDKKGVSLGQSRQPN